MIKKSVCKDCQRRAIGCHSICLAFEQEQKLRQEQLKKEYSQRNGEAITSSYEIARNNKNSKRKISDRSGGRKRWH